MRGRFLARSGLATCLLLASAATATAETSLQLQTCWGCLRTTSITLDTETAPPSGIGLPAPAARDVPDVNGILRYQPRVVERAPYLPGARVNDNVATALIVTGGAALVTSIVVDWLRK